MNVLRELVDLFRNPPAEFRSIPFWAWNDRLQEKELVSQIESMKEQGMGGFFMHSRDGLETEYMGPEWLQCVQASVEAAKANGMKAWLYDEDRWPSGSGGGAVPAKGDAYRAKGLTLEVRKGEFTPHREVCALFRAVIDGMNVIRCRRLETGRTQTLQKDEVFLVFRVEVSAPSEWFNNEAPPDNMNPECVKQFLDHNYEPYRKAFHQEFGKTIPGIFTDEPSVHDRHCAFTPGRGWIPWTYGFPAFFMEQRGYDLLEEVPYIFFEGEKSTRARHDYWRTVSELFCSAYTKQLSRWCEENGLLFTGHYLWENQLGIATRVGGAMMPHYRYQHIPGMDLLCEQIDEIITVKQCTSVANQYGRKFVLSEMYGCTGWEFTFEGQKWLGDWQYVMGVNLRSQHLALYSLKGCRKRDYPPVFNYNTSWWKYNHVIEDYFARLGAVLTQGKVVREVLVLHPSSTAWSMLGTDPYGFADRGSDRDIPEVNGYGEYFNGFMQYLLGIHYDFDLGDETIMAEEGSVRDNLIYLKQAAYKAVVLPSIRTMLESTRELLLRFMEAGGTVIAVKPVATMIEGRKWEHYREFFCHPNMTIVDKTGDLAPVLEKTVPRKISIRNKYCNEAPELLYMLRKLEKGMLLFVVNTDRHSSHEVTITLDSGGAVEEWNPLTGEINALEAAVGKGQVQLESCFGPAASKLLLVKEPEEAVEKAADEPVRYKGMDTSMKSGMFALNNKVHAVLGPVCRFTRTMPNVLVLDQCTFRVEDGQWSGPMEVWQAQRNIREALGMRPVYSNGLLQRYKWIHEPHPMDGRRVEFKFLFQVEAVPENDLFLVLEKSEDFRVSVNGEWMNREADGWFLDRSFDRIRLGNVKVGSNELLLSCEYRNRMEVEDCYIIGDFGVDLSRRIVAEPEQLRLGDWCTQGYFHYCGSLIYHFDFSCRDIGQEKAVLELGDFSAVTVEVRVNGEPAGHIPWRSANRLDITRLIKEGANRLDIEVMGSPRNMFGPFHQARGHLPWTDWASFRREGCEYTPEYLLEPYGLFEQIKIHKA